MKLLEERPPIRSITVMVQKEAAERLCAAVGSRECGAVTAAVNYYSTPRLLFKVGRGSFMPSPNVDSAVMQIQLHSERPWNIADETLFFRMVKAGFSQRRKQLGGVLSGAMGIPKKEVSAIFERAELVPSVRMESLTMEELAKLSNVLFEFRNADKI